MFSHLDASRHWSDSSWVGEGFLWDHSTQLFPTSVFQKNTARIYIFLRNPYNDVIMSAMASQITSLAIVTQPFIRAQIKENIDAPRYWPSLGEFTVHRWIPRPKGPVTREMFPFDEVNMLLFGGLQVRMQWVHPSHDSKHWYIVYIHYALLLLMSCFR